MFWVPASEGMDVPETAICDNESVELVGFLMGYDSSVILKRFSI